MTMPPFKEPHGSLRLPYLHGLLICQARWRPLGLLMRSFPGSMPAVTSHWVHFALKTQGELSTSPWSSRPQHNGLQDTKLALCSRHPSSMPFSSSSASMPCFICN